MPRRSRPRISRHRRSERNMKLLGAACIAVVIAAVAAAFLFMPKHRELDPQTWCPTSGPTSITAVLLDQTDSISDVTAQDIARRLTDYLGDIPTGGLVEFFGVSQNPSAAATALIELCNPGSPDEVSELTGNKQLSRLRFQERFLMPVQERLHDLLHAAPAASSPLMESVQALAVAAFPVSSDSQDIPRRLIIVSDLMQHSPALSLYRSVGAYSDMQKNPAAAGIMPSLYDVDIKLLVVQRLVHGRLNGDDVINFWRQWLDGHGGRTTGIIRLAGVNQ